MYGGTCPYRKAPKAGLRNRWKNGMNLDRSKISFKLWFNNCFFDGQCVYFFAYWKPISSRLVSVFLLNLRNLFPIQQPCAATSAYGLLQGPCNYTCTVVKLGAATVPLQPLHPNLNKWDCLYWDTAPCRQTQPSHGPMLLYTCVNEAKSLCLLLFTFFFHCHLPAYQTLNQHNHK